MEHKKLPRIAFIFSLLLFNASLAFHAQAETLASTYGPISSTDSLLAIATKLKPSEDISNYQMMVALYKNNPKAFYTENMNSLKAGAKLEAPSENTIRAITPEEARHIYSEHNLAWKARKEESKTSSSTEKNTDVLALAPTLPNNDLKENLSLPLRVAGEEAAITSEPEKLETKKEVTAKPSEKVLDKKATHPKQTDAAPTVAALSASIKDLTEKVDDLSSQLASNQEELTSLQQEVHQLKKDAFSGSVVANLPEEGGNNNLTYLLGGLSFGFSILVGLGTWGFIRYRKANPKPQPVAKKATKRKPRVTKQQTLSKEPQEPREEKIRLTPPLLQGYNFQEEKVSQREEINKEEAVLNKLDLASAYIEMGEHEEAVIILQEILEEGNTTQRNEAKNLLSKIEMVS